MAKKRAENLLSELVSFDGVIDDEAETHWRGMPEFNQPDNGAYRQIIISFEDEAGVRAFGKLIDQTITSKTKSLWFPDRPTNHVYNLFYFGNNDDDAGNDDDDQEREEK